MREWCVGFSITRTDGLVMLAGEYNNIMKCTSRAMVFVYRGGLDFSNSSSSRCAIAMERYADVRH